MQQLNWKFTSLIVMIFMGALTGCQSQEKDDLLTDERCGYLVGELPAEHLTWEDFPEYEQTDAFYLAMESDRTFYPKEATIFSIQNDLQQIRSLYSQDTTTTAKAMPCTSSSLIIGFTDEAYSEVTDNTYSSWNEINERFGIAEIKTLDSSKAAGLSFKRFYNGMILHKLYQQKGLEGIKYIEHDHYFGGSQDICMEESSEGERTYVFWQGSGDCPAGCLNHRYSGYEIDGDNNINKLGVFERTGSKNPPEWFEGLKHCPSQLKN